MNDSQTLAALAARLESAEANLAGLHRKSRRERRLVAGALCVGASLFLMGQAAPAKKAVVAESFALVGPDGKVRGGMGTGKSGGASVFLMDSTNKKRIHLTVSKKGTPAMNLLDGEGKVRMSFGVAKDGMSFVAQKDANGKIRNFMFTGANGSPNFRQKDGAGKNVTQLPKKK